MQRQYVYFVLFPYMMSPFNIIILSRDMKVVGLLDTVDSTIVDTVPSCGINGLIWMLASKFIPSQVEVELMNKTTNT